MTPGLQPYPEYKDSGDAWLGCVPTHWFLTSLGAISLRRSERNRPDLPLLSVLRERGVVLRSSLSEEENRNFIPDDLKNYRVARAGDLTVNKMKAWQGSVGIAPVDGIVSPAYFVFSLNGISQPFAHRLLRSRVYADFFARASDGIRIGQWDLHIAQMKRIPVAIPPDNEQDPVVRFLNIIDRRVSRFIRNRRRLIRVLKEQRQAIINQAVTRGLETDVSMKPVEIDQFDEIPAHWDVSRVKYEFDCLDHRRVPLSSTERGKMTSRRYDYYGASGAIDKVDDYLFDDELLLLAEDGANLVLRNLPLAIIAKGKFWVNNHAHILKPKRGNIYYLAYLMEMIDYRSWITGAAQPKLTGDRLMRIWIPVPPVGEQKAIVEKIEFETASLTAAIDKAQREIDLIREYRTRLITDVVTGKVDVRHLAPETDEAWPEDMDEGLDDVIVGEEETELVQEVTDADD